MKHISFFATAFTALIIANVAVAGELSCRVLYRISCAPDLCEAVDKVVEHIPQIPKIEMTISADRKTMIYVEEGKKQTVGIRVTKLSNDVRLVTGRIDWPRYERAPGDSKTATLGKVNMLFNGMEYHWRVEFLGINASQEEEDILIGDCAGEKW